MQVKKIRLEKGLSVPKLVELSGVPRRTIQQVEKNDTCTVATAKKLAIALNVSLDELCADDPPSNEN
jgi:transcriptional regulator with XRE-family HTH domain